jgi:hypothetical protein
MAGSDILRSISLVADSSVASATGVPGQTTSGSDNSGKQYRFVKVTARRTCGLADTTSNEVVIGVLQNKPQVTGAACTVAVSGVSLVEAGGTISAGAAVKVNATGKAVAATLSADAALVVGVALEAGTSGKLVSVLLRVG